jgi:FkbM family methyltransferase
VLEKLFTWVSTGVHLVRESAWALQESLRAGSTTFPGTFSTAERIVTKKHLALLSHRPPRHERIFDLDLQLQDYADFQVMFFEIFVWNSYAFETENPRPFILDCGANIGMSACYFKKRYPTSRLIVFEPDKATHDILKANVEQNALEDVSVRNAAVYETAGTIDFYTTDDRTAGACNSLKMSALPTRVDNPKKNTVQSVLLSDSIDGPVDFLKMDIEGAEYAVLSELHEKGKLRFIRQMVIEYHHHVDKDRDDLSKMLKLLEDDGFGYQISAKCTGLLERQRFQDIMVFAYQKNCA